MIGFNGGLIGKPRDTSTADSVPGVWTLPEQVVAAQRSQWPGLPDPYFANVSLLLHGDGSDGSTTFTDSSSNNLAITANGNVQIDTAESKFGGASILYDGNGDFLTAAQNSLFEFGTGDFTVECWARTPTASSTMTVLLYANYTGSFAGSNISWGLDLSVATSSALRFFYWVGTTQHATTTTATLSNNTWHHLAATRESGQTRVFVDGVRTNGTLNSSSPNTPTGRTFTSGINFTSSGNQRYFNGHLDDIRITKGVARYTSDFTPPARAFPDR